MSIVNRTRNVFVNSEEYHSSNGDVALLFNSSDFSVTNNEIMKISLEKFEMKRNFYNINGYNNKFYYSTIATNKLQGEIVIKQGDYTTFGLDSVVGTLTNAIKVAITGTVGTAPTSVTYNNVTRKFAIAMPTSANVNNFYFFQIPPSRQLNGATFNTFNNSQITTEGMFNDSYEILGSIPTKSEDPIMDGFDSVISGSTNTFTSFYPASLFTMESINITTNLQTHTYSTPHLDANSSNSLLIPTNIFGRVWFDYNDSGVPTQIIKFNDTGAQVFSMELQNKSINEMRLSLTDSKGRPLEQVNEDQFANGALAYTAVLRWEAISSPELGVPSGFVSNNRQMKLTQF